MRRYLLLASCMAALAFGSSVEADAPVGVAESEPHERLVEAVRVEVLDARDRVVLELDGATQFLATDIREGVARLEVRGAALSADVARDVAGPLGSAIRGVHVEVADGSLRLSADAPDASRAYAVRAGRRILWVFERNDQHAAGMRGVTVARNAALERVVEEADVAAFTAEAGLQVGATRTSRRYAGRRIDLDFHEADIHNVLRLIAEVGNVNIVAGDDVQGAVTVRMRDVPWDLALETVLQARGMGMVRSGNLIRVAPLARLQAELEARIRAMQAAREVAPLETRVIPLSYNDANGVQPQITRLLTERGTVTTDPYTNTLIVQDVADVLDNVESLVRVLDRQTPQVLIEARIVEATSRYTREVGIQWGGDVAQSTQTGNPTGIRFPYNWSLAGGSGGGGPYAGLDPFGAPGSTPNQNPNFLVNLPAAVGAGTGGGIGLTLGSVGGNVNLSARLTAAESSGTIRIISSPRILTLNNAEASISQGTLIPYSQFSAMGVNTAWRSAKLELKVTPRVSADGTVLMAVQITRDEPDFSNRSTRGDPTILQRAAQTTLIVPDGSTAVIGGIYTRTTSRSRQQIPIFGDIPVLGALFRNRGYRDERSELLIFLTPRIVNRAAALIE